MSLGSSLDRARAWIAGMALVALACAAFAFAARGELVLDDLAFLPANPRLDAISSPLVFFGSRVWDHSNVAGADVPLYRPVFMVALWAGRRLLGEDAFAWHVAVLLLHAASSVLVWRLARRLLPDSPPLAPLAAGIVFAVHPVHAEAVAWILAFVHPLATLLSLAAAHAALTHAGAGRRSALLAACLLAAAAMLTSEGALAVPPLLVALDWAVRRRLRPAIVVAHAVGPVLVLLLRWRVAGAGVPTSGLAAALPVAADFLAGYLRLLIVPWPQHLHLTLPRSGVAGPFAWWVAGAAVLASTWIVRRVPGGGRAVPLLALAWIWISLLPLAVGGLNTRPLFAPRALYLPSVGVALLVAWLLRDVPAWAGGWVRAGTALFAVAGLVASNAAAGGWTSNATVYARAAATDPESTDLRVKLGEVLAERGEAAAAEASFRAAARLAPRTAAGAPALEALASHLGRSGRLDEAEAALREALALAPARSSAWVGLGNVAYLRGDFVGARERYLRAVELDARNYEAQSNLALACEAAGDVEAAGRHRAVAHALRTGGPEGRAR